jgi:hypothetical protein
MGSLLSDILAKVNAMRESPVAFEALWDGDTTGWFVEVSAVVGDPLSGFRALRLAFLREPGGDFRVFRGQVPPWPEAEQARDIGQALSQRFGVPFFFPSPNHPEDDCPHWWEQDVATACRRCGIPLLQIDPCPWRGVCHQCHCQTEKATKPG